VKLITRTLFVVILIVIVSALIVTGNYVTLPTHNASQTHFDTIVVLGTPSQADGTPSPEQRERVLEGVREYKAGVAPHIIMTGGPAHNHFVEAHTMAQLAATQGIPASDILEEPQALNTIQNIYYSAQLMHQHDWSSAEVISSPNHLGRTALILDTFNRTQPTLSIDWSTHPAPWPEEYSLPRELLLDYGEALRCLQLRIKGFPPSKFLPAH
ncbi:MAG TPA: YdcF family protein, partial [Edaphobacter sp.]